MGYLLPGNPVDDFPQGLVWLAGKDSLQTQCPPPQGFSHTYVQVVVRLLGCQVLGREGTAFFISPQPGSSPSRLKDPLVVGYSLPHQSSHHSLPVAPPAPPPPQGTYNHIKAGIEAHDLSCRSWRGRGEGERKTGKRFRSEPGCCARA